MVPGQCFTAGTLVLLGDGSSVPIEQAKIGDRVVTTDPDTGRETPHRVTRLSRHDNAPVFEVVVGGAKITATPQHPFWVAGQGWVTVDRLLPGDRLVQPDDTTVSVESVRDTGTTATVYNFEVEGAHDYYVQAGTHWILVHNDCSDAAWDIAMHAYDQHGSALGVKSVEEMASHVDSVMNASRGVLRDDGSRFWADHANGGIIFRGPNAGVPGTYYRPDNFAKAWADNMGRSVMES